MAHYAIWKLQAIDPDDASSKPKISKAHSSFRLKTKIVPVIKSIPTYC